ncbi:TadE-like protein [Desulfotomaculum arcticum]|uniref:TadE-like protein n=1 Tax=Desulfotruncus arcticus DSM 17038 TaxID=1121424 RepID=A0A1I2Z919_9FIRM|nr:TadE family protein [Desulfotruncus arcticus]SFH34039.1 TadE-like protein [Desulfotomaculum arcticum] [Desulfotruncus arcticus DSM 17038]
MNIVSDIRKNLIKNQKGVIIIEAALSFIVLLIFFLGLVTMSFIFKDYINIQKVAREGAREACITGNIDRAYDTAVQTAWLWGMDTNRLTVKFRKDSIGNRNLETCVVTYRVNLFSKTFPKLAGGSSLTDFNINAQATFGWQDFT